MSGLKVKLDWTGIKTRIIPYADPQSEVGTTNRIYGSPVIVPILITILMSIQNMFSLQKNKE